MFGICQNKKSQIFHDNSTNFHDPWVGTDTPGPGEAVFEVKNQKFKRPEAKQQEKLPQQKLENYFLTKMKIARNPEGFQVPGVVEMNPTGLPELF